MTRKEIIQEIFRAIDEVNSLLPAEKKLKKRAETILFGNSSSLDSLGLVNLVVAVEQRMEDRFGVAVTLADEKAISEKNSPFRSVEIFADYIFSVLKNHINV